MFNISREPLEVSSPTTFKAVSFSRDRSTTTVWGQRRVTAQSSGRSLQPPRLTPSLSGILPPIRSSPTAVAPRPTGPGSRFPTSVRMASRSFLRQWPAKASNHSSADQTLELKEWEPLPSLLSVSVLKFWLNKYIFTFTLSRSSAALCSGCLLFKLRPNRFYSWANWVQHGLCSGLVF